MDDTEETMKELTDLCDALGVFLQKRRAKVGVASDALVNVLANGLALMVMARIGKLPEDAPPEDVATFCRDFAVEFDKKIVNTLHTLQELKAAALEELVGVNVRLVYQDGNEYKDMPRGEPGPVTMESAVLVTNPETNEVEVVGGSSKVIGAFATQNSKKVH